MPLSHWLPVPLFPSPTEYHPLCSVPGLRLGVRVTRGSGTRWDQNTTGLVSVHMAGDVPVPLCPSPSTIVSQRHENGTQRDWYTMELWRYKDGLRGRYSDRSCVLVLQANQLESLFRGPDTMPCRQVEIAGAIIWRPVGSTMPRPLYDGLWEALCRGLYMTA